MLFGKFCRLMTCFCSQKHQTIVYLVLIQSKSKRLRMNPKKFMLLGADNLSHSGEAPCGVCGKVLALTQFLLYMLFLGSQEILTLCI